MATARSNKYDYPVGYEPMIETETLELDRRTVRRLDSLLEPGETYEELINELVSIHVASELNSVRTDSPLIE
ncbi:hypothetical protein ACFQJC_16025 [Haloferax namakaokahaiae]|uniref:Uncharacterized protein n=1 Tax=Haloferax namakaokahaiae TaxID=1748331 RepID=A0ABD5ZII7_9EURY